jgi:hypothetical protein
LEWRFVADSGNPRLSHRLDEAPTAIEIDAPAVRQGGSRTASAWRSTLAAVYVPVGKGKPEVLVEECTEQQLAKFLDWYDKNSKSPAAQKRADVAVCARARLAELRAGEQAAAATEQQRTQASPPPAAEPKQQRQGKGKQQPAAMPAETEALAKVDPGVQALQRVRDVEAINKRLAELSRRMHLVTPASEIEHVPEGFGVSVSMVTVNKDATPRGPGEVYKVGGKLALAKVSLEKIWAGAGGEWIPHLTGRLDNGKDPRYWRYRAVGRVSNFDGTPRIVTGEVELDARDGSDLINEITEKAKAREKDREYQGKRDGGASQILELRKFLGRHAESKAKNRAIASIGVKRAYNPGELDKPFAIVRLVFTGHSDDPTLRRELSLMNARAAIQGTYALFGGTPTPALPPAVAGNYDAPPVGEAGEGVGADEIPDGEIDNEGEPPSSDLGIDDEDDNDDEQGET